LSDLVAERVRKLRKERGLTAAELAARCAEAGMPQLTTQVIYKLEGQRTNRAPRPVTVDEVLVLADALTVPPAVLVPELLQGPGDLDASLFDGIGDMIAKLEHMRDVVLPGLEAERRGPRPKVERLPGRRVQMTWPAGDED